MQCDAVNLGGGTTPNHPCTTIGIDPFSVEWCSVVDYVRVRRATQIERNALVEHLLAYRDLLLAGKPGSMTPRIRSALALQLEVAKVLADMPETAFQLAISPNFTPTQGTLVLAQLAQRLHHATCEVASEIEALGVTPPGLPVQPPEPGGIKDKMMEWGEAAVKTAGLVVGAGLLLVGGLWVAGRISRQTAREAAAAIPAADARALAPATTPRAPVRDRRAP